MKFKLLVASVALATAQVQAGGFENARLDTSFMYDEGNLVSFGSVRKDFTVNGSSLGTTSSLIGDRNASNLSARYEVNDQLSFGLTSYDSGAIHINYQGAGSAGGLPSLVNAIGPKVNLTADSIVVMGRYAFSDNFSLTGGLRNDKFKVSNADVFGLQGGVDKPKVSSASDTVPVLAVAYERRDIALRLELLYQGRSEVAMPTTCAYVLPSLLSCSTDVSTGGLAEFMTLNFQSGIMEDTLLLASIHKGKWTKSQLSVADTGLLISPTIDQTGPTSAFNDSTEYSVGLARRINDSLAVTASYNWENSGDGTTGSLFTINDGYKGITLGARYVIEDLELSVGYNYTELGDVNYSNTDGSLTNELRDNKVQAIGAKVAFRF